VYLGILATSGYALVIYPQRAARASFAALGNSTN
jgi:hypothetical protein